MNTLQISFLIQRYFPRFIPVLKKPILARGKRIEKEIASNHA